MSRLRATRPLLLGFLLIWACSEPVGPPDPPGPPPVSSVRIEPSSATIVVGSHARLTAVTRDSAGNVLTGRQIYWSSSSTSMAEVDQNGLVLGRSVGAPVTISATSEEIVGTATISVIPVPVASVQITPPGPHSVHPGGSLALAAAPLDSSGNVLPDRPVGWSTSDSATATVSGDGLVRARAVGPPVTITATSESAKETVTVYVVPVPVASLSVEPAGPHTLEIGRTLDLRAVARDSAGNVLTGRAVSWASSDAATAEVDADGLVRARQEGGPVTITVSSEGHTASVQVRVRPVPVARVVVTPNGPHELELGSSLDLNAAAYDSAGGLLTGRTVGWMSSDAALAPVSGSGRVSATAVGGPVTITATVEGVRGTSTVSIVPVRIVSVTVSPDHGSIFMGDSLDLDAHAWDARGVQVTGRAVTWRSSDTSVARVSPAGTVTGVASGAVTITATADTISGDATIEVSPPAFALALPDGRVRIHPQVIRASEFDPSEPLWLGWVGNQFLRPFEPDSPYAGMIPSRLNAVTRVASGEHAGWYETRLPVVGGCFTVLQLSPAGPRWADLGSWSGEAGILTAHGRKVMRLPDDGAAEERLRSWIVRYTENDRQYVRFAPAVVPVSLDAVSGAWKLVGSANWNPADGRSVRVDAEGGLVADVSGLRRYANVTAKAADGRDVWALYGHLGTGEIDLSGAGCLAPATGFRHPHVRADSDGAGLWLNAEMPDDPPYLNRNGSEGDVWWPDPDEPPAEVVPGFTAATPWFTIVDDPRAPEPSRVEIDYLRLYARVDGRDTLISRNEYDDDRVGGSYYARMDTAPWFGRELGPVPDVSWRENGALILPVGDHPEWIWHVWMHDPWRSAEGQHYRRTLPAGTDLVWTEARLRIRGAAAAQVGFDHYRDVVENGCDKNDDGTYVAKEEDGWCEGGKSRYLFEVFENEGWMTVRSDATTWHVSPPQQ